MECLRNTKKPTERPSRVLQWANEAYNEALKAHPESEAIFIRIWDNLNSAGSAWEDAVIEHCFNEGIDNVFAR